MSIPIQEISTTSFFAWPNIGTYAGSLNINLFSTGVTPARTQYNKDELGTNLVTLGINPVVQFNVGTSETLSLTNELLGWDNIAVGSLLVAGNVTKGTETAQFITSSNGAIVIPNKLYANNIVDATDSIGNAGQFLTVNASNIPLWSSVPNPTVYIGQYYKSAAQTLTSGNTYISFDLTQSWNNTGGYITHTNGTDEFTVVQSGIYKLEFNAAIATNAAVYSVTSNKTVSIDITRSPTVVAIIQNSCLQATGQPYQMSLSSSYYLIAGDIIALRVFNSFTGGPPTVLGVSNTYDLNTFFTWTFIA